MDMGSELSKSEQKNIQGSKMKRGCAAGTDSICCGTANWQCGVGPASGGFFNSSNGTCDCA